MRRYVTYCMNKVKLLQHYGIKPYIVFDGGPLPSKGGTETDRAACVVVVRISVRKLST